MEKEFKLLDELENSEHLSDRVEYAKRLKYYILKLEEQLPTVKEIDDGETILLNYDKNKEVIRDLKIKLSNYDIYRQKIDNYGGTSNMQREYESILTEQSALRGEAVEEVRRTTGNDSGNIEREVGLPF